MLAIEQPEVEALIQRRLVAGGFASVEEVLLQALTDAPLPEKSLGPIKVETGTNLLTFLRSSPLNGLEIDFDSYRHAMPVREVEL